MSENNFKYFFKINLVYVIFKTIFFFYKEDAITFFFFNIKLFCFYNNIIRYTTVSFMRFLLLSNM